MLLQGRQECHSLRVSLTYSKLTELSCGLLQPIIAVISGLIWKLNLGTHVGPESQSVNMVPAKTVHEILLLQKPMKVLGDWTLNVHAPPLTTGHGTSFALHLNIALRPAR